VRITLLFLALLACGSAPEPEVEAPEPDPDAPRRYRVLRGDTLRTIASKRSCQPSDIVGWNGLGEDPLLVPGQILLIYRANQQVAVRRTDPSGDDNEALPGRTPEPGGGDGVAMVEMPDPDPRADPRAPRPAGRPSPQPSPTPSAQPSAQPSGQPEPRPSQVASAPKAQPKRIDVGGKRMSPQGTEILSLLDELGDSELKHVKTVSGSGKTPGEAGLGDRSLGDAGGVDNEKVTIERPKSSSPASAKLGAPGSTPKLAKASPKRCLPVVLEDLGDKGMATPDGLDRDGIRTGMAPIVKAVGACMSSDTSGTWDIHLELTVGCDGMVYKTDVVMDGGLPRDITRCVSQVADQGSFPAAQGVTTFVYPIRFQK